MGCLLGRVSTVLFMALAACASPAPDASVADQQEQAPALASPETRASGRKPNIIIFFADDLGYGGLRVQGDKEAVTPHIDALANHGVRLTDFYSNHPVCSPSRAALMTGIYQHRMGFEFNSGSPANTSPKFGIALDVPTLPERLKAQGYTTGMFGKWHVGFRPETQPNGRGFDSFYGFLSGAHPYTPEGAQGQRGAGGGGEAGRTSMLRNRSPAPMPAHLTEAFGEEAVTFIKANKDRPFFLYMPFNAVHAPMHTSKAYEERFASVADRTRRVHLAQLAALDDVVGQVTQTLRDNGIEDDTLIFFSSDNGGPTQQTTSSNGPLNGVKGLVLEGGIRVPTIVQWKGVLPEGKVVDTVGVGFDITATALAAAGALPAKGLDGVDLMPYLKGAKAGQAHDALYWRSGAQGAMRSGDWKLVKAGDAWYLFDLGSDIGERNDLAAKEPARLQRMRVAWETWSGEMKQPLWVRNELAGGDGPRAGLAGVEAIGRFIRGEAVEVNSAD